jgi:hypothetical protein
VARIPLTPLDPSGSSPRDRGFGTVFPTTDLRRGDIYLHTSLGLHFYTGSAWRQRGPHELTATQRAALDTSALYPGYRVYETDTQRTWHWTGSGAGLGWAYLGGGSVPLVALPLDTAVMVNYGTGPAFADFSQCRYGRDASGIVHFWGLGKNVSSIAAGATVTIVPVGGLPVGYRPNAGAATAEVMLAAYSSTTLLRIDVYGDGSVKVVNNGTAAVPALAFIPLSAVSYPTGAQIG